MQTKIILGLTFGFMYIRLNPSNRERGRLGKRRAAGLPTNSQMMILTGSFQYIVLVSEGGSMAESFITNFSACLDINRLTNDREAFGIIYT